MNTTITCYLDNGKNELVSIHHKLTSITTVDLEDIQNRTFGVEVAQIDIVRQDGSISRFWVTVRGNNRNQAVCEVTACDLGKPQSRKKSIIGSWFKKKNE